MKKLVLLMVFLSAHGDACRDLCKQGRTYGLRSADCYNKDIKQIPQCLRSDIEVIDLSYNRIRQVTKEDLEKYLDIKMLYLQENMIMEIEEEALSDKSSLEILDVSYNAFISIPSVIFHLPSLKKLYVSQNQNINIVDEIEKAKPIVSPLALLDIGFNKLTVLPDLGIVPTLVKYNISGNNGVKISMKHFAGLCNLQILINVNISAEFDEPCECWNLETWLRKRDVYFSSFECETAISDCNYQIPEDYQTTYSKCKEIHEAAILKSLILKIVVPACIILVVLVAAGIFFFVRRRRQKHAKNNNKLYNVSEELIKHGGN